tara:strand:- start:99 stop:413 length:315 start_codon:yes stop_codon:yes gene_type:complete
MSKKSKRKAKAKEAKARKKIENQSLKISKFDQMVESQFHRITMACVAWGRYDCVLPANICDFGDDFVLECQSEDLSNINVNNWKIVPNPLEKGARPTTEFLSRV